MIRRMPMLVAGALVLGLAACGTDGPRGPLVERDVVKGERATATEAPTPALDDPGEGEDPDAAAAGTSGTRPPLPLDELWESAYGWDLETEAARARHVEELTAQCMADEGFDYLPLAVTGGGADVEWGSREFAERYGYGASTDPWNVYLDQTDPNDDYVATLTDAELEDYLAALYGDWSRYDDWTEEERESRVWTWETNGCNGWAQHQVDGDAPTEDFEALWVDLEAMWTVAANDPRMRVASEGWAACMADAGHPGLVDPQDSEYRFHDEVDLLYDEIYGSLDWQDPDADWAAADRELEVRLAALTAREITTAIADRECRDGTGYDDVEHEVYFEYESEFLRTHGAEVDAYLAAFATGNA